jgi:hypothetical protein
MKKSVSAIAPCPVATLHAHGVRAGRKTEKRRDECMVRTRDAVGEGPDIPSTQPQRIIDLAAYALTL